MQRKFLDLLVESGWTRAEAGRQIGKTRGYMTRVLSGETTPSASVVEILELRVRAGKYPQRDETVLVANEPGIIERARQGAIEIMETITAPIIAFAQGGEGAYPEDMEHESPRIAVPCKDPNCYVLELHGDSMEPIYLAGDLLVIAPNMEPMHNDLVIVKTTEEEVLFKKFKHPRKANSEEFQFLSFNPHHPALTLRPDQIFKISVVHSVIRPLKEKVRAMTVDPLSKMR